MRVQNRISREFDSGKVVFRKPLEGSRVFDLCWCSDRKAGMKVNSTSITLYRAVCISYYGYPPRSLECNHLCGNGGGTFWCYNPSHLSWNTRKANMIDKVNHGRWKGGEGMKNVHAKNDHKDVLAAIGMRKKGMRLVDIAEIFCVHFSTVHKWCKGKSRRNC